MQIEDFKVWVDLVNTRSFSKCAELNYLSQPAISQKIKGLKTALGDALFSRRGRELILTPGGKILYEQGQKILAEHQKIFNQIKLAAGEIAGEIKIAAIYSIGLYELNKHIKDFLKKYPKVNPAVEFSGPAKIYSGLLEERIEIGFVAFPKPQRWLEIKPFKQDHLVLITHPDHPLGNNKSIDIKKIDGQDFIGFKEDLPTREALNDIFKKYRIQPRIKMEFDNIELIKRAVEINAGISILPWETVKEEVEHHRLKAVPFRGQKFPRPLGLIYKKNRPLSPAAQKFIEEVTA